MIYDLLLDKSHDIIKTHNNVVITNNDVLKYLDSIVHLDDGFTLRDYFAMLSKYNNLQMIDYHFPFLMETYRECTKYRYIEEKIGDLVVERIITYDPVRLSSETNLELDESSKTIEWIDTHICLTGEYDGLEFYKLFDLMDHNIRLGKTNLIYYDSNGNYTLNETPGQFTLFEFLKSVIVEIFD